MTKIESKQAVPLRRLQMRPKQTKVRNQGQKMPGIRRSLVLAHGGASDFRWAVAGSEGCFKNHWQSLYLKHLYNIIPIATATEMYIYIYTQCTSCTNFANNVKNKHIYIYLVFNIHKYIYIYTPYTKQTPYQHVGGMHWAPVAESLHSTPRLERVPFVQGER